MMHQTSSTRRRRASWREAWLRLGAGTLLAWSSFGFAGGEVTSYAIVNDDATLAVAGRHIRLYGIHIPDTTRVCDSRIRPVRCGSRAAQALRFKIQGFVTCSLGGRFPDRSVAAYCTVEGEDLGGYLIKRGWAVALPQAPFEYQTLERIARHRGFGVWGFNADATTPGP